MRKSLQFLLLFIFFYVICDAQSNNDGKIITDSNLQHTSPAPEKVFAKIEVESWFPGGHNGWVQYLNTNLQYPGKARRKKVEGTVAVRFIVERDGSISNVEAISGDELLRDEAIRVIKISPRWIPGLQNGKVVRSYKIQPITFKLG
jgi:periplasmic protein TonB